MNINPSGYSGTPLSKKLGIKPGFNIKIINPPTNYFELLDPLPEPLFFSNTEDSPKDFIHFFTSQVNDLVSLLPQLKEDIKPNGMIWVSWPKKSSKIPSEINENLIRQNALNTGLVDIKVCAVDEIWSGLKLVIPLKDRK
ncbi:DUF3052 family protein [Echinicola jeungdonensis]|uniref:DUF3052 family protein n=1 Tax=Echinicola jeungdonensis TaxID=709343 RepID=A0ABV5JA10_9BACT|nr:DUF3052 family protein [Echinicola jeungdonensis]MDN3670163.1 DUF3052 family protein [Echinicola jeungdonensis]